MSKLTYLFLVLIAINCAKDSRMKNEVSLNCMPPISTAKNILVLGNSITEGSDYRYLLWKQLVDAGYKHHFVGNRLGAADDYPMYKGLRFSNRHQGVSGITTVEVAQQMDAWMKALKAVPDMALIHLGTNDAEVVFEGKATMEEVTSSMRAIIGALRRKNPKMTIYLAQIIPLNTEFPKQNKLVPQINANWAALATELQTDDSQIILVDCHNGFELGDLGDAWHPNEQGSAKMAQRFAKAILQ
ncbi:GDSL-type esterase/lipase family protein [Seonamhaeicola sp.]|uniref:GDSL-type esterase/lipase family protein n=1 Tax=Seonamhaeicola sp. TaxID=1912245 RepID=UPI002608848E|nr:GDSL-type esterase/lipase family protein [Seonamhaeicola sp.]